MDNSIKQEIITRISDRGAQVKNWMLVSISGIYAIRGQFPLWTLFIVFLFWRLNAFYLSVEHKHRDGGLTTDIYRLMFKKYLRSFYGTIFFVVLISNFSIKEVCVDKTTILSPMKVEDYTDETIKEKVRTMMSAGVFESRIWEFIEDAQDGRIRNIIPEKTKTEKSCKYQIVRITQQT